jgi:hypothetical protein
VVDGWIKPIAQAATHWQFDSKSAAALLKDLQFNYRDVAEAAALTDQTAHQFRKTWIDTAFIQVHRFGARVLVATAAFAQIAEVWATAATSTAIGKQLNRPRWLCPNLEKMNHLTPSVILGSGTKKVRLYPRNAETLRRYNRG